MKILSFGQIRSSYRIGPKGNPMGFAQPEKMESEATVREITPSHRLVLQPENRIGDDEKIGLFCVLFWGSRRNCANKIVKICRQFRHNLTGSETYKTSGNPRSAVDFWLNLTRPGSIPVRVEWIFSQFLPYGSVDFRRMSLGSGTPRRPSFRFHVTWKL